MGRISRSSKGGEKGDHKSDGDGCLEKVAGYFWGFPQPGGDVFALLLRSGQDLAYVNDTVTFHVIFLSLEDGNPRDSTGSAITEDRRGFS